MFYQGDVVSDDTGLAGTIHEIDPIEKQHPDSWAFVVNDTTNDSMWNQLKYLKRVD